MKFSYQHFSLPFITPAKTSSVTYSKRDLWYVFLENDGFTAIGEVAPLPHLSMESHAEIESALQGIEKSCNSGDQNWRSYARDISSITFAVEMLDQAHRQQTPYKYFDCPFASGSESIEINGLIWMADFETMSNALEKKLAEGWRCIKLKIGAIDFEQELQLLSQIRERFSRAELELRVDANGAFSADNVHQVFDELSRFDLHSIEQPVPPGNWDLMAELVKQRKVPVALDEELIPQRTETDKLALLEHVQPDYIVLKPSLIGGFEAANRWLTHAKHYNIGAWVTSALESNLGLLAIAQWTAQKSLPGYQGLGTGLLFKRNFPVPLEMANGKLRQDSHQLWSEAYDKIEAFLNPTKEYILHTSGSTGDPKPIKAEKSGMEYAATVTDESIGIRPGDTMLICLPMRYVAAQMQLIRAWCNALKIRFLEPGIDQLLAADMQVQIASLVPYQLDQILSSGSNLRIQKVLVGGAPVSSLLRERCSRSGIEIWETYGMTETYANIALKKIGQDSYFKCIGDTKISLDKRGCLQLRSEGRKLRLLQTNDLAEIIDDSHFLIEGRIDEIINSGGIKVNPRNIEDVLADQLSGQRFFIAGVPSQDFGQVVALFIEGSKQPLDFEMLEKAEKPKYIIPLARFPLLETGKIDKQATMKLAHEQLQAL